MNNEKKQFLLEVSSDLDYEKMVVNIIFSNSQIATLSCDKGLNQAQIEFLSSSSDEVIWAANFQDFIKILNLAFQKLQQANEES